MKQPQPTNKIIPLTICLENCNELINDARRRILSSEARKFADGGIKPRRIWRKESTYFSGVIVEHEKLFWMDVYKRRLARIKRMNDAPQTTNNND